MKTFEIFILQILSISNSDSVPHDARRVACVVTKRGSFVTIPFIASSLDVQGQFNIAEINCQIAIEWVEGRFIA